MNFFKKAEVSDVEPFYSDSSMKRTLSYLKTTSVPGKNPCVVPKVVVVACKSFSLQSLSHSSNGVSETYYKVVVTGAGRL